MNTTIQAQLERAKQAARNNPRSTKKTSPDASTPNWLATYSEERYSEITINLKQLIEKMPLMKNSSDAVRNSFYDTIIQEASRVLYITEYLIEQNKELSEEEKTNQLDQSEKVFTQALNEIALELALDQDPSAKPQS